MTLEVRRLRHHACLSRSVLVGRDRHSYFKGHVADILQMRVYARGGQPVLQDPVERRQMTATSKIHAETEVVKGSKCTEIRTKTLDVSPRHVIVCLLGQDAQNLNVIPNLEY